MRVLHRTIDARGRPFGPEAGYKSVTKRAKSEAISRAEPVTIQQLTRGEWLDFMWLNQRGETVRSMWMDANGLHYVDHVTPSQCGGSESQAQSEARWRNQQMLGPYGLTEAGDAAGGVAALHAMGLTLAELEALGLIME